MTFSEATKPRRMPVTTDRLQRSLILDQQQLRQPLPPDARTKCIELIARMLLHALRREAQQEQEVPRESR
jgi:hypothetical protein